MYCRLLAFDGAIVVRKVKGSKVKCLSVYRDGLHLDMILLLR